MYTVLFLIMIAALLHGCDPVGPHQSTAVDGGAGYGGMGGAGGSCMGSSSTSSSSSSSSGVTSTCDLAYVATVCDVCKVVGCPMAKDTWEPCLRIGVVHYTDMIGCIQLVPGACPTCPENATFGNSISTDCADCISQTTACSMDCTTEVYAGQ